MTRAVIYLRISQDRHGDGLAIERQREDCQLIARQRGWDTITEYSDTISASNKHKSRPGYDSMIQAWERGEFDALICYDLDRLTRQPRQLEDWIERAEDRGLRLVTANGEADLTTDGGVLYARIKAAVARGEVDRKSARQRRAQEQAAQQGRRAGGRRPFGYETDGVTIREDEATAVRHAYAMALAGESLATIARSLNETGFNSPQKTRAGDVSPWRRDSVRNLLLNPRTMGMRQYKGEVIGPAVWPALVDEGTWQAVADILRNPARRSGVPMETFLLTSIARCGVCGSTVNGARAGKGRHRIYRCGDSPGHLARRAADVEAYVELYILERLARPDAAELLVDQDNGDAAELRAEAHKLRARLDGLAVDYADGNLTGAQVSTATKRIESRLTEIERQTADSGRKTILHGLIGAADIEAAWDGLSRSRQRAVVDTLATVTVHPPGRGVRTFRPETVEVEPK